jgi:hypothetical protein
MLGVLILVVGHLGALLFGQASFTLEPDFILKWRPLYEPFKLK